jgi:hypothetical protein
VNSIPSNDSSGIKREFINVIIALQLPIGIAIWLYLDVLFVVWMILSGNWMPTWFW